MVVKKHKKVTKYRAQRTHGGGSGKKRRGAGSRGGRGNAGTGKRAGHKKAGRPLSLGRRGFTHLPLLQKMKTVNVGYFTMSTVAKLLHEGKAVQEDNAVSINLQKLGYTKLLGAGTVELKLKINVPFCSEQAAEKIKAAGGEVTTAAGKN